MTKTPLAERLRILAGKKILILNAPHGYMKTLGELPEGVTLENVPQGMYDIVHSFFTKLDELEKQADELKSALGDDAILWISYPKKSAKQDSDLSRDIVWSYLGEKGLKAVAQISIDDTWSAMRFKQIS